MKTITLKADENLDKTLGAIAKQTKKTKSAIIRAAVYHYQQHLERESLRSRLKQASLNTRYQVKRITKELDASNADGL